MSKTTDNSGSAESSGPAAVGDLAERYLDFWQRNLMIWSADPDLFEKWSAQILDRSGTGHTGTPGRKEPDEGH